MTRLLTIITLLAVALGGSSCGNLAEEIGEAFADAVGETFMAHMLDVSMTLGMTAEAFYVDKGRWPRSRDELMTFCRENGWESLASHLEEYEEVSFKDGSGEHVEVRYAYGGAESEGMGLKLSGTFNLERSCSVEEDCDGLTEWLGKFDQMLAKKRRAPDWLARRTDM